MRIVLFELLIATVFPMNKPMEPNYYSTKTICVIPLLDVRKPYYEFKQMRSIIRNTYLEAILNQNII